MVIEERYHAVNMAADTSKTFDSAQICGGFLAVTAGTITVTATAADGSTTLLNAFPVAAGTAYKFSIYTGTQGFRVALAGGASGTLLHV